MAKRVKMKLIIIKNFKCLGDSLFMVSKNNLKLKERYLSEKQIPHFGLRHLSVGVASVLLSTSFYFGATAHADSAVDSTVSNNSDANKISNDAQPQQTDNDSLTLSQSGADNNNSATPVDTINSSANLQPQSASSADSNITTQSLNVSSASSSSADPAILLANLTQITASTNNCANNGGFDPNTWGTLDVSKWTGQEKNGVYELTGYTGDLNHIIVPNSADFAKAGKNVGQVGISADTTHSWFKNGSPKSIAFSKTDNKMIKAIGYDWTAAFTGTYNRMGDVKNQSHELTKFDGSALNVSNVTNMNKMFYGNRISDLISLTNWKTDNVTNMGYMFYGDRISDLRPLANWKTDNVTNMGAMFNNNQISDLRPLASWKTDNVTNMGDMFYNNQISDLTPLANWKTDKVTSIDGMFATNQISDLAPLANWKTNNVTSMGYMFDNNQISDLAPLANWKTNNVTNMSYVFHGNQISDLYSLPNWNIENVNNISSMFANNDFKYANLSNWQFGKIQYLKSFIYKTSHKVICVKTNQDKLKLLSTSPSSSYDSNKDSNLYSLPNRLHFGSDAVDMPTIYIADNAIEARKQILADIDKRVADYEANHSNVTLVSTTPLYSKATSLVDLANATFVVVPKFSANDTAVSSNMTTSASSTATQDEHQINADKFNVYGSTINIPKTSYPVTVTQIINVPDTLNGVDEFNPALIGPIQLLDADSNNQTNNAIIYYSQSSADLTNPDSFINAVTTDQVTDWSKIRSIKIVYQQKANVEPITLTAKLSLIDPNIYNDANKSIYANSLTYAQMPQQAILQVIDDDDNEKVLTSFTATGFTGDMIDFKDSNNNDVDVNSLIAQYESQGYEYVDGRYANNTVRFDGINDLDGASQVFTIHLKHHASPVTVTLNGIDQSGLNLDLEYDDYKQPYLTHFEGANDTRRIYLTDQQAQQVIDAKNQNKAFTFYRAYVPDNHPTQPATTTANKYVLDPVTIQPGQKGSAKLTIKGQSTISTLIRYTDDNGQSHDVVLSDKSKTYQDGIDTMNRTDFLKSDNDLTDQDKQLLPANLVIDYTHPIIENSNNTYLDGFANNLAEFNTTAKYDYDGDRVIFNAKLKRSITQTKTVTRTIHYQYDNGQPAHADMTQTSTTLNKHGLQNPYTDAIEWTDDGGTAQLASVTSPLIAGYTPNPKDVAPLTVDFNSDDTVVTVIYHADTQNAIINYVDDTNGKTLKSDKVSGKSKDAINYQSQLQINQFVNQHYRLVSSNYNDGQEYYDTNDNADQIFTIHLTHDTKLAEENSTVNETIHYVYADNQPRSGKAAEDYNAVVTFKRTGTTDLVDNSTNWNEWQPSSHDFASITSPSIAGYIPDTKSVAQITARPNDRSIVKTVTYVADTQKIIINFVDDATKQKLSAKTLTGQSDTACAYTSADDISNYLAQHYVLVSDETTNKQLIFDHDTNTDQIYNIHFTHGTKPTSEASTVSETIHYIYADHQPRLGKASSDYMTSIVFKRTGITDLVTNTDTWNEWTPGDSYTFTAVLSPEIDGYVPDKSQINSITVQPNNKNVEQTVTYSANQQKAIVNYIDDITGKTLSTKILTGNSDTDSDYTTKNTINNYINQHYQLVSDDTKGNNIFFDHNDNENQTYNVHLTHATKQTADSSTVNETIHYVYAANQPRTGQAASDYTAHVTFNRTGVTDLVTNTTSWNKWTPNSDYSFTSVESPIVDGYIPDTQIVKNAIIHPHDNNIEQTVTYSASQQKIIINYIDDTLGKSFKSETLTGFSDTNANYSTKSTIDQFINQHYQLVSDDTSGQQLRFDHDNNVDQIYDIHFVHENQKANQESTIVETIHYVYADGQPRSGKASNDYVASITFKRTGKTDMTSNSTDWNVWMPVDYSFPYVESPTIDGYTPDQDSIISVMAYPNDTNIEKTVSYHANQQTILVNFVDDTTGETLSTKTLTGKSDSLANYTTSNDMNMYLSHHFKLVADETNGKPLVFDHDDTTDQVYNVHLVHETQPATDEATVNETIHYAYDLHQPRSGKAADDYNATVTFKRTGITDLVDNSTKWNEWQPSSHDFAAVISPTISGYTPDTQVMTDLHVTPTSDNIDRTVSYTADKQNLDVKFIDDTDDGKSIKNVALTGLSDSDADYNTQTDIANFTNKGYLLVSDQTDGRELTFDADDNVNQYYEVHLKHNLTPISQDMTKHETIHYVYQNGQKANDDVTNAIQFNRTGLHDHVLDQDNWNDWTSENDMFNAIKSPLINGYTPNTMTINTIKMTPKMDDQVITVTYAPNTQKLDVAFIDDTTNQQLKNVVKSGPSDTPAYYVTAGDIDNYIRHNYELVSDSTNGAKLMFDHNDNVDQHYEVHLKHKTHQVTRNSTVNETINYVFENGKTAHSSYNAEPITFTQTGTYDDVTNNINWDPVAEQSFKAVDSPIVEGYTPDITTVLAKTAKFGDNDVVITVTYKADPQKLVVNFIDDTTHKKLKAVAKTGASDEDSKYSTVDDLNNYETQGYKLVSDNTHGQELFFDHDDQKDQLYEVHLVHNMTDVKRTSTIKETIHYQYADGKTAYDDYSAPEINFVQTGQHDDVTDTINWNPVESQAFKAVNSPLIDGYTADTKAVPSITVNFDDKNIEKTVTYHPNEQKLDVTFIDDTTNKTLQVVNKTGLSDTSANYQTKDDIAKYLDKGYKLVSDSTDGKALTFDHHDKIDQHYEVHLKHGLTNVSRTSVINETIHYVFTDGKLAHKDYQASPLEFVQNGVKDNVTDNIEWNPVDTQQFNEVKSPLIEGYTPDKQAISAIAVKFGDNNIEQTVTYHPDKQRLTVTFIDDNTTQTLKTVEKDGLSDEQAGYSTKQDITDYLTHGYKLVSDDTNGENLIFDHIDNVDQAYTVHLKHGLTNVSRNSTVNEVVYYVFANGKFAHDDYNGEPITFTQTGVKDGVTNIVNWNPVKEQQFKEVKSPIINGYTSDIKIVPAQTVDFGTKDIEYTVTYAPDAQKFTVEYIDDVTGNKLNSVTKTGVSDADSSYNTKDTIADYTAQGYKLVSDPTDGKSIIFDHNDSVDQHYIVHFTHQIENVTRNDDISETVHYLYSDGNIAHNDYVAKPLHFVQTGIKDLVTNDIKWNDVARQTFTSVTSPVIKGYTADQPTVASQIANFGDYDKDIIVIYHADSCAASIKYIDDTTGDTLKTDQTTGKYNQTISFKENPLDVIDDYEANGYVLVSNSFNNQKYKLDKTDNQFVVHLKHGTEPVTNTVTVKRTIKYVDANTGVTIHAPKIQVLTFIEQGTKDMVTGNVTYKLPKDQRFTSVNSPLIDGYLAPDILTVNGKLVSFNDPDETVVVKYKKQPVKQNKQEPVTKPTAVSVKQAEPKAEPVQVQKVETPVVQRHVAENVTPTTTPQNKPQATLPQTGNTNQDLTALGLGLLTGTAAGLLGLKRKQRKSKETK